MNDSEKLQRLFERFTEIAGEAIPHATRGGDYFVGRYQKHVGYLLDALTGEERGRMSWSSVGIGAYEAKDVFGELYDVGLIDAPLHRAAKQNLGRISAMAQRLNVDSPPEVRPASFDPVANTNDLATR